MLYIKKIEDQQKLENWIDDLGFKTIRESDIVQRLKKIRFLGTLPYFEKLNANYSRYDHSINVAKIADAISRQLNTSEKFRKLLILAALLHDIGHLPFSHASEVFFRQTWKRYHTSHGARLAYHLAKYLKLNELGGLAKEVELASNLLHQRERLENEFENTLFFEIFHGSLSADTLDGIIRAAESIGLDFDDPSGLISGFVRYNNSISILSSHFEYIYKFLRLKKKIYSEYVYSARGMAAEAMLTRVIEITFREETQKSDFMSLDDDSMVERIRHDAKAFQLLSELEAGKLFYSLREYAPEKHKLIESIFANLNTENLDPFFVKKSIEECFMKQLSVTQDQLILHASIRLKFWDEIVYQRDLFSSMLSLKNLTKKFSTQKNFGNSIDLFMPEKMLPRVASLEVPREIKIFQRDSPNNLINSVEQHFGTYMTPEKVAGFMVEWAIRNDSVERILDPASGEGVFIKAAHRKLVKMGIPPIKAIKKVFGIEIDKSRWQNSLSNWEGDVFPNPKQIVNENFFEYFDCLDRQSPEKFDVIIGNPPYINFHRFTGRRREESIQLAKKLTNVLLSKRSNSWAPYLLCSLWLLKKEGRLGMVLPHELLTTDYANLIRSHLETRFKSLVFVFNEKKLFNNLQSVLLLLASNDKPYGKFKIVLKDLNALNTSFVNCKITKVVESDWLEGKWSNVLVSNQNVLGIIKKYHSGNKIVKLRKYAKVSIGLVTGNNDFFLLSKNEIEKYSINTKWTIPVLTRTSHIKGVIFQHNDFNNLKIGNESCFLLNIPSSADINSELSLNSYLKEGKSREIDQRYKCRTRWPWYSIPMQGIPSAFLTYMSGKQVRLILNDCKIHSTNTIHNVNFIDNLPLELKKALIASFYCSISQLSIELIGRSYGGGVLKLEIGEAENILIPDIIKADLSIVRKLSNLLNIIDDEVRGGGISCECISVLDNIINKLLNLSKQEYIDIKEELQSLRKRRLT